MNEMMTVESSQTGIDEIFEPLYQLEIPQIQELVPCNDSVLGQISKWIETAHMIAFTIEQNIKRGDIETFNMEPLEAGIERMWPVIQALTEQEESLKITKIQSEWSGLQHFISFIKSLIDTANERYMLRTLMESILLQIDDLSIMIFQFQEKRHTLALFPVEDSKKEESILVEIDNRVGPLFNHVEKVYTRMASDNPPEDSTGLLTRKHLLVQEKWECLRIEIDELKMELKEDRWLTVFNQVADQVDEMMNGLEKTVHQYYQTLQQINVNATSELLSRLHSIEKNFEAKYKYYTPSITKMLMMLGNGIAARVSKNGTILQRHETMMVRWNNLKATMDQLRKNSDSNMTEQSWSRASDRSDSTSSSHRLYHKEDAFMEFSVSKNLVSSPSPLFMERPFMKSPPAREIKKSVDEEEDDNMISTKDFRKPTMMRSMTPNLRRSGTPSMIPRPKTPNCNNKVKLMESVTRPRSSMARITNNSTRTQSPLTLRKKPPTKKLYKPDPRDALDKEIATIVNQSPIPIQCSKKSDHGDGKYYFGNELTPSLGGGKKIYTCKLMTYENSGRNKVLIRVGGGWQDLEIFLLEHMNLIG